MIDKEAKYCEFCVELLDDFVYGPDILKKVREGTIRVPDEARTRLEENWGSGGPFTKEDTRLYKKHVERTTADSAELPKSWEFGVGFFVRAILFVIAMIVSGLLYGPWGPGFVFSAVVFLSCICMDFNAPTGAPEISSYFVILVILLLASLVCSAITFWLYTNAIVILGGHAVLLSFACLSRHV